jgi:tRNA(fMet)-specific endonuclease VapC
MIRFVLDTNTISELMRERPHPGLEARLGRCRSACALPAPVVDELQYGVSRIPAAGRRDMYQRWLEVLMADFPVIPVDGMCAQWHGRERARLGAQGRPPPLYDGLIASIAVVNELTLVTHNAADFSRFSGIRLEDWMTSSP